MLIILIITLKRYKLIKILYMFKDKIKILNSNKIYIKKINL